MEYVIQGKKQDRWIIYGIGILICLALLARDIIGNGVNKYIFLILAAVPIFFASLQNMVIFMCFLIPLYVGLPSNLISVCLLIRLLFEALRHKIQLSGSGFILSYLIVTYILIQDILTGYTGVYHIMAAFDFLTLFLMMAAIIQYAQVKQSIIGFAIGNFVLGIIMLSATLSFYSLADLMNPATRLGYTGMLLNSSDASMATSIDPNFYAMNVIATLTTGCLLLSQRLFKWEKIFLIVSMLGCIVFCLIGLSRTFVVLLAIWGILWLFCQRNVKRAFSVLAVGIILIIAFFQFMPIVATGLLERFSGADVIGGNGRMNLILKYFEPWYESIETVLFGIGLFNCHTHCAPLMYLFGLGIVGTIPLVGWFLYNWRQCKRYVTKLSLRQCIPVIITFISFSSIPAAGAINYTLPILIAMSAVMIQEPRRSVQK